MGTGHRYSAVVLGTLVASLLLGAAFTSAAAAESPKVSEQVPVWVDKQDVTLRASVDPSGLPTVYRFDLGTDTNYGIKVPAGDEPSIGAGTDPVPVTAVANGLQQETVYHFRVVATNSSGTTVGPDQEFTTLNEAGLPSGRAFELVSPREKGPAGEPVSPLAIYEMLFQASPDDSNLLYQIGYGPPSSTSSGGPLWQATREESGWQSTQFSPSALVPAGERGGEAPTAITWGISPDLECSVLASTQPLAGDAPPATAQAGLANLFRRNPDGTYTTITNLVATNVTTLGSGFSITAGLYQLIGMSEDCGVIVFRSRLLYPGLPGAAAVRLYEWDHGILRAISEVPGPTGVQAVATVPGATEGNPAAATDAQNWVRAVSSDGSRVFFSAFRQKGGGPGGATEVGKPAVFARLDGSSTLDISQSQTGTASTLAKYQIASADGRRVFFLANYGLTSTATPGWPTACTPTTGAGCDLYEYDFAKAEGGRLTSLSQDSNPADTGGAGVAGVLDASDDGEYVYFAARGQLVLGQGSTQAENISNETYNVYLSHNGVTSYVGRVLTNDLTGQAGALITKSSQASQATWASQATPDGRHLVFSSKANISGYQSGAIETYLYSAAQGTIVCVSCRRDGEPSISPVAQNPLTNGEALRNLLSPPRAVSDDGARVFFVKNDPLAPGAAAAQRNLFEWHQGQIAFIARSQPGFEPNVLRFGGVSASGTDVYFSTRDSLSWEDGDTRPDVYDARIGGGFEQPVAPVSCDPLSEASCRGPITGGPPSVVPSSTVTTGAGNVSNAKCKKSQVRRGGRCVLKREIAERRCANRKGDAKRRCIREQVRKLNRAADGNGRAAK